jgi:hypothetical protein
MKSFGIGNLSRANWFWFILPVFVTLLAAAADDEPPWRSKQIAEWSVEDANQVLFDSPWAITFTPILTAAGGQRPKTRRHWPRVGRSRTGRSRPSAPGPRGSTSVGWHSSTGRISSRAIDQQLVERAAETYASLGERDAGADGRAEGPRQQCARC